MAWGVRGGIGSGSSVGSMSTSAPSYSGPSMTGPGATYAYRQEEGRKKSQETQNAFNALMGKAYSDILNKIRALENSSSMTDQSMLNYYLGLFEQLNSKKASDRQMLLRRYQRGELYGFDQARGKISGIKG